MIYLDGKYVENIEVIDFLLQIFSLELKKTSISRSYERF